MPPELQKSCLQSAGVKWRQFKTTLTTDHIMPYKGQKKKLLKPPKQYAYVGKETWRRFVAERISTKWQVCINVFKLFVFCIFFRTDHVS